MNAFYDKWHNTILTIGFAAIVCLFVINVSLSRTAAADEPRCTNGFVTRTIERVCDNQLAIVCYVTHENGHGIEMMSCVKL